MMHIFHSREHIKTCIYTAVKIQDLIFSQDWNYFFLFSQYGLGTQRFMAYLFLF